ncbi:hypothetical protein [Acinetobacter tjernbergiae]|uniref:DUF4422 domain-containing protein n=1 Tax=Acinetobacter tjernbergiae DSM 14971 = CIP 107465 TaxID=1120928 RepID=V2V390_9GAMM|nr:hypothetical protein [Acinetobacter tjernbergiae]ESK56742.1 hypothetical protein F990_00814 [Acinetobacter tjernbergiae DSM 14971 = CIP 107465]
MAVNLYQLQYDDETSALPESGFLTYDCRATPEFLKREVAHLIRFYDDVVVDADVNDYFALLSPKFNYKTGLTASDITAFIRENDQQDIYLFNPYPMHVYNFMNVWEQAEVNHPEIISIVNYLFCQARIGFRASDLHRNSLNQVVYCNYWVAKKSFLDEFIKFLKKLDHTIELMPSCQKNIYFNRTEYKVDACFYPFVFERMITTFLFINHQYKSLSYIYDRNFNGYNTLNRIERKFYYGESRKIFDLWESNNERGVEEIERIVNILSNVFQPKIYVPYVGKLLRSLVKTLNVYRIDNIVKENIKS